MPSVLNLRRRLKAFPRFRSPVREAERIQEIRGLSRKLIAVADSDLQIAVDDLRTTLASTPDLDTNTILVPAFALVNESLRRSIGFEFYDVQLLAGIALTQRSVAEMQTGEGKTVVVALPAFVHALRGRGVHVATVNEYLAERDFELMSPVFERLGMSTGLITQDGQTDQKRLAYDCDITYGTGHDFGFDYLRDQVAVRGSAGRRLGDEFRVIDEIDSVLIDDATSPLVISEHSGAEAEDAAAHKAALNVLGTLENVTHYELNTCAGTVALTKSGREFIYQQVDAIPVDCLRRPWTEYVEQSLRAHYLFRRDVHYVLNDGEVQIVDQSTGRIHEERKWRDGLHQAIEAREGVVITSENYPLARITRQRFYRLYDSLAGMTGTTMGAEKEFRSFYNLPVVRIPLRLPTERQILEPAYFATTSEKWNSVVDEIITVRNNGRPVLVGTRTISASETLAEKLTEKDIPFALLNGLQDQEEADIIAQAGQPGAVTIATNMAGRGTDIKIHQDQLNAGGLHVIATERHESRRVDRQLIGRSGRQGNPGSARFYVAADDYLLSRHRPVLTKTMATAAVQADGTIGDYTGPVLATQRRVERKQFSERRQMFRMDKDRDTVMAKLVGTKDNSDSPAED
ncbi:UNVERIFIED_CONTAM: hypothetical protein GTU68_061249 [Idotea baltica]|nr:hypothetical protein [Idotea baltica]